MTKVQLDNIKADQLLADLLSDPETFEIRGSANELLKQFFRGYPLAKLKPLLHHPNNKVIRAGMWMASELGKQAALFLDDAIAALEHADDRVRYSALDVIMVATTDEHQSDFIHIIRHLDDPDIGVRQKALRLLSHATDRQIAEAAARLESEEPHSFHLNWIRSLLEAKSIDVAKVEEMIQSNNSLRCRYGVAIAERLYDTYPHLLKLAADHKDKEFGSVAEHMIRLHNI